MPVPMPNLHPILAAGFWRIVLGFCLLGLLLPVQAIAQDKRVSLIISGVQGEPRRNVEAALQLPAGLVHQGEVNERWLERFVTEIPQQVDEALQPFGYYHSQVEVQTVSDQQGDYGLRILIDPGPPVRVRSLDLQLRGEGRKNRALKRASSAFPLAVGDVLHHQLYRQGKVDLRLAAKEEGYIKAAFSQQVIRVFPEENAADIELTLETGPLFYFGETTLMDKGGRFDEAFLRRFLSYNPGQIFSHKLVQRTRLNFHHANRFAEVQVIPLIEEAEDHRIPVRIELVAGPQQRLRPGIGYGTNSGSRISLNYQNMSFAETHHAFVSDLSLAEKRQVFDNRYTIPLQGSIDDKLITAAVYQYEDTESFESEIMFAEVERVFGLLLGETGTIFLRYQFEDYDIGEESGVAHMTMPGLRYYRRSYDDPLNPSRGYQVRLELRGALDALLSDVSFGQVLAAGRYIHPLGHGFTLLTRIDGAMTLKSRGLASIPPSLRFFVGGDNNVRGYEYKSEGPRNRDGDVVGSDSMLVGSVELEYALTENWGVAIFYDVGSAFNAFNNIRFIEGAGIGVRRRTPIGPIKVDLASKIAEDPGSLRLHISIGFDI